MALLFCSRNKEDNFIRFFHNLQKNVAPEAAFQGGGEEGCMGRCKNVNTNRDR